MGQNNREIRNIIGERVKEARKRHNPPLTQDQLSGRLAAHGLQLDRVAIAKIETGFRCAFDFEVKALAAAMQVDANWLLGAKPASRPQKSRTAAGRKGKA
jgi:hypothetical protein